MFFQEGRNYTFFRFSFHPPAFNLFKGRGRALLVVVSLRREVSRVVVVGHWYVQVEGERHFDGHRRGVCLVVVSAAALWDLPAHEAGVRPIPLVRLRPPPAEVRPSRSVGFH